MIDPFNPIEQDSDQSTTDGPMPLLALMMSTQMLNDKRDFARHANAAVRQVVATRGEGSAFAELLHAMLDHLPIKEAVTLAAAMIVLAAGGNDTEPLNDDEVAEIVELLSHVS